ncbi:MAG: exopolyphosphatase, partial [Bacteroidetes bacterium]|nr:exopolyphosphatase [Bacteroidota bacterium]
LNGSRIDKRISYQELQVLYDLIDKHSYEERIIYFGMRSDRVDVILPATKIFLNIMKWAKSTEIFVPKFGLSDGILRVLHEGLEM